MVTLVAESLLHVNFLLLFNKSASTKPNLEGRTTGTLGTTQSLALSCAQPPLLALGLENFLLTIRSNMIDHCKVAELVPGALPSNHQKEKLCTSCARCTGVKHRTSQS
jgi:hypothetical protein